MSYTFDLVSIHFGHGDVYISLNGFYNYGMVDLSFETNQIPHLFNVRVSNQHSDVFSLRSR